MLRGFVEQAFEKTCGKDGARSNLHCGIRVLPPAYARSLHLFFPAVIV
jgi:hypothetical protein